MGEKKRSPLWAIPLALIPLVLVWIINYLLYTEVGVGKHRDAYDLVRSDEDVFQSTYRKGDPECDQGPETRWIGSVEKPTIGVLLGSSPTAFALDNPQVFEAEKALNLNLHCLWDSIVPVDRFYDRLKIILTFSEVDLVVLEVNLTFANDYLLGFRDRTAPFKNPWNPNHSIYDEELLSLQREFGLPAKSVGTPRTYRMALDVLKHQMHGDHWMEVHGRRESYRTREISALAEPLLLSNNSMIYVLARIARLCRAKGIGLVIFVPPRFESLVVYRAAAGVEVIDPAVASRRSLRLAAALGGFKVFDYDDAFRKRENFRDGLHLNARGSKIFTSRFMADLGEFLHAEKKDTSYVVVGEEEVGEPDDGAISK